jgi:3-hydroxyacyl-CoA dehydrogenase/3a,7a,12a-trihydroxy-5b-cholest-24-enoyl-CoA hydratase
LIFGKRGNPVASGSCGHTARMLHFNGRVAIVTGSGGGLGREYALLLASRGCSVVVNDLDKAAADKVVAEIKQSGGKAVACYASVENGEQIVKQALDSFGRIDILINNAGILRDKSLLKMTEQDWDIIQQVHLKGSFLVTKAAWPHMRQQGYGRIIMTSSSAGLYGNFGQTNYAAAKMGLIGLSNTLAVEGAKYNIHSNVIIPIAASRLTADILPEQLLKRLLPSYVAPVVAYLCHENCPENGGIFEASGGWVARYKLHRSKGKVFHDDLTLESLEKNWAELSSMDGGAYFGSVSEHFGAVVQSLQDAEASWGAPINEPPPVAAAYQAKGSDGDGSNNSNKNDDDALLKSIPTSGHKCDIIFNLIDSRMRDEPELLEQLKAVFQYNITQNGKQITTWTTDTKHDIAVYNSEPRNNIKPDCTVTVDDEDFVKIMIGKLNPQRAFIMGKLNVKGNVLLLQKLNTMWTQIQMAGKAPELPLLASAVLNYKLIPGAKCDAMFVEMITRLARDPHVVKDLKSIFRLHINKDGQEIACYTINLTDKEPSFYRGAGQSDKADFELFMDDDDFVRLMYGRLKLADCIESGRVRLAGNKETALKLQTLFSHFKTSKL